MSRLQNLNGRTTWLLDASGHIYDGGIGRTVVAGIAYSVTAGHIGYAEGIISTITIGDESWPEVKMEKETVGTTSLSGGKGRWTKSDAITYGSVKREHTLPDEVGTYDWDLTGKVDLFPYHYQVSTTHGGGVSIPASITGNYSKTGRWIAGPRDAMDSPAYSTTHGSFVIKERFKCGQCDDTTSVEDKADLSPKHGIVTCSRDGCDVQYRKCDTYNKTKHSLCKGCNTYRCDTSTGNIHEQVQCTDTFWDPYQGTVSVESCGNKYWACASDSGNHRSVTFCAGCSKNYKGCVASNHARQASCLVSNEPGEHCTVKDFYKCGTHIHQFPGSQTGYGSGSGSSNNGGGQQGNGGGQQGNGGDQQGNNQNNGDDPPAAGNLLPSNGGCTTVAACSNTNCQLTTPCTTYTCVREIRVSPRRDGSWVTRPCGESFTKCQDSISWQRRGNCTGDRVTTMRTYHSDLYR